MSVIIVIATLFCLTANCITTVSADSFLNFNYYINNEKVHITSYNGNASELIIPDSILGLPVVSIDSNAFYGCVSLETVVIPEGVGSIWYNAFKDCTTLRSVSIPQSVGWIGGSAFENCPSLTDIYFGGTRQAWQIIVSHMHLGYGQNVIIHCTDDWDYTVESSTATISRYYGHEANVEIPDMMYGYPVTSVGTGAFSGCDFIETVLIPEGVGSIWYDAFKDCTSLRNVSVPQSVGWIGGSAFENCPSLTDVYFGGTISEWKIMDSHMYLGISNSVSIHCSDGIIRGNHTYYPSVIDPTYTQCGYTEYVCSECGDSFNSDYTDPLGNNLACSASLNLSDSVDIRIYVKNVTDEMISDNCYVEYSEDGETFSRAFFDSDHFFSNGKYGFIAASFAANRLTQQLVFRVCDAEGNVIKSITYSVSDYCNYQFVNSTNPDMRTLCSALMAYGFYSQILFPDGASAPVDPSVCSDGIEAVETFDENLDVYTGSASYASPVTGANASLALESRTVLCIYLNGVGSADGAEVTVGDEPWYDFTVDPVTDTRCRVNINGLSTVDLTKQVVLTYEGTVISYSAMAYVKHAIQNNMAESDACRALYLYVKAARAYFTTV
ncbi:MAG: leucine-rich repeat domain-containing protein [Clostridia bacterium]|nr:leucine-rich repeat domain-containing protein [Clostridia bacterium]